MRWAACIVGIALLAKNAGAQRAIGIAVVDSAAAARSAWGRAAAALDAEDLAGARREVDRAARAWPTQPAYLWARASLAARAGDTAVLLDALRAYATLGLGRDLHAERAIAPFVRLASVASLAQWHDSNRGSVSRSRVVASLTDSTFWPEGVDYDPWSGKYYVTSVARRMIAEVTPGKGSREVWPRDQANLAAVLGVRVDAARGVLWATLSSVRSAGDDRRRDATVAALIRVRIADGAIERRWDLAPSLLGHALGDVAIGPRGDVFVTDSNDPVLYRLRPGSGTLERITNALFHSLQGIAPTRDGRALYVADYSHGLLRVDLASGTTTRLGDPLHVTSLGCDGIALTGDGRALIAIQNGVSPARVMRFDLDRSGVRIVRATVLDQNPAIADEPTSGVVVGREFVYVGNSQWDKHGDDGRVLPGARLRPPVLLAVPLVP